MKNNSEDVMEDDRRGLQHKVNLNFNKVILLQSTDKVLIEKKKKKALVLASSKLKAQNRCWNTDGAAWYRRAISSMFKLPPRLRLNVFICVKQRAVKMLYGGSRNTDLYRKPLICSKRDPLCACVCTPIPCALGSVWCDSQQHNRPPVIINFDAQPNVIMYGWLHDLLLDILWSSYCNELAECLMYGPPLEGEK